MARIIPFRADEHHEVQLLLPWYVQARLEEAERAWVEAHLAGCAACAAELELERDLSAELAEPPLDADRGWARLRERMAAETMSRRARSGAWRPTPTAWGAIAATLCVTVLAGMLTFRNLEAPRYQTLGAQPSHAAGSMVVIFRPDAKEEDFRRILDQAHARLVDGPTAAGAYVLDAPAGARAAALTALRRQPQVVLAQPIDGGVGGL